MTIKLEALRLQAMTSDGPFGAEVEFADGLVLVRADNSHGKSTVMQSVLYALGLEAVLGPKHEVPLPAAMTSMLRRPDGQEVAVLESSVLLQFRGATGASVTVQRWAAHPSIDKNLIRVWRGPALQDTTQSFEQVDSFVRRPGAAQREAGFHSLLADLVGWNLPRLVTSDGREAPLYMELLFPLFFVEQKRGWGGIQANMPPYSGLPDTRKRAIEFVLALGVYRRIRERQELNAALNRIRSDYQAALSTFRARIAGSGLVLQGYASDLPATWPPAVPPALVIPDPQGDWSSLEQHLGDLRSRLLDLQSEQIPSSDGAAPEVQAHLDELEQEMGQLSATGSELLRSIQLASAEIGSLDDRVRSLTEDRRRYQDALTLHDMGSDQEPHIVGNECPTCHQPLPSGLLLAHEGHPMSLSENLHFIEEQLHTFEEMRTNATRQTDAQRERLAAIRERLTQINRDVRVKRSTLVSAANVPSASAVHERLRLEDTIETLGRASEEAVSLVEQVHSLVTEGNEVRARLASMPPSGLDEEDEGKLARLEESLVEQLTQYGFTSVPPASIGVSRDSYLPAREGYDL